MRAHSEVIQFTLDRAAVHEEWAAREVDPSCAEQLRQAAREYRRIAELIRKTSEPARVPSGGRVVLVSEWPGRGPGST